VNSIKGVSMSLGSTYLNKFNIGDYVYWRTIIRDNNYDEYYREQWGIILKFEIKKDYMKTKRSIHYALIMENSTGRSIPVLLHKIQKVETN
tara:strand:- start:345 stop:617 length:273 start_codon:yes stop_codon:yes gene_type:complete